MKLYIATLIHVLPFFRPLSKTFASADPKAVAKQVCETLVAESETGEVNVLWNEDQILNLCMYPSQGVEDNPLEIEIEGEAELGHEFVLSTAVVEVPILISSVEAQQIYDIARSNVTPEGADVASTTNPVAAYYRAVAKIFNNRKR